MAAAARYALPVLFQTYTHGTTTLKAVSGSAFLLVAMSCYLPTHSLALRRQLLLNTVYSISSTYQEEAAAAGLETDQSQVTR